MKHWTDRKKAILDIYHKAVGLNETVKGVEMKPAPAKKTFTKRADNVL
jgi:hypothetical protein